MEFIDLIPKEITQNIAERVHKRLDVICGLLKEGDKVLDVGCGTGAYISNALGYLPIYITAIDYDSKSIKYAQNRNQHKNLEFVLASDESFETKHKFDLVICNHILAHSPTPLSILKNVREFVKEGGLLCVGIPNGFGCFEIENFIPRMMYKVAWGQELTRKVRGTVIKDSLNIDSQHVQFFTIGGITQLLEKTGWEVMEQVNEDVFCGMISDRILSRIPLLDKWNIWIADKLPAQIAAGWIFICKKE